MSRHRLFIPVAIRREQALDLHGEQAHYLSRVLRMKAGDRVTVFDGSGPEFPATISQVRRNKTTLSVGKPEYRDVESPLAVRLIQGVSRGDRMDFTVQKATELGVHGIRPVLTEFSVVKLDADRASRRVQHWQKIARHACEQCGRNRVPEIAEPIALRDYLALETDAGSRLVLCPGSPTTLLDYAHDAGGMDLLIGPEGGLSAAEEGDALAGGFVAASMGPRILRSETAAVVALALVQARWGDFQA